MTAIVPVYDLPITGPIAAGGALSLWRPKDPARRRALWFALIWCGSAVAATALLYLGAPVAAHRILGFAYALPVLAAAALVWAARAGWRAGRTVPRAAGIVVLVGGLAVSAFATERQWFRSHASLPAATFAQAATAGAYLERYAPGRPAVVVIDGAPGLVPLAERVFRASVPADRIATTLPYLGDPDRLLAGQPTVRGDPAFDTASRLNLDHLRPLLSKDPVVVMVSSLDRRYRALTRANPGWVVAPGVAVVSGPRPVAPLAAAPTPRAVSGRSLVLRAGAVLLLLSVVGVGWAWSLVPAGWFERLALTPAFGVAALSLAGVAADRLGMVFPGPAGMGVAAGAAAAGWAARILVRAVPPRSAPTTP